MPNFIFVSVVFSHSSFYGCCLKVAATVSAYVNRRLWSEIMLKYTSGNQKRKSYGEMLLMSLGKITLLCLPVYLSFYPIRWMNVKMTIQQNSDFSIYICASLSYSFVHFLPFYVNMNQHIHKRTHICHSSKSSTSPLLYKLHTYIFISISVCSA